MFGPNGNGLIDLVVISKVLDSDLFSSGGKHDAEIVSALKDVGETCKATAAKLNEVTAKVDRLEDRLDKLERNQQNNHERIRKLESAEGTKAKG